MDDQRKRNRNLRYQRDIRGWSQRKVAEAVGTSESIVSNWERGKQVPDTYYREQLCLLFEKNAEELGFLENQYGAKPSQVQPCVEFDQASPLSPPVPPMLIHRSPLDILQETDNTPEQQLGAWLALGAGNLAQLYNEQWTTDDILTSLQIVLRGVQHMPHIKRRQLLQLGVAAFLSGIPPLASAKHVSAAERAQLHTALGESIASGWSLFHRSGNAQVLAVGQAQLYLIQQSHSTISSRVRAGFYTSVYNLIGKAQHFQECYQASLEAHTNAHIAALAIGDPWYVTQSLICQADSHQALGQHIEAIETIEEALRVLGNPVDEENIRTKAHLFACWADNAMTMEDYVMAQRKLDESSVYLDQISPNEEFDHANWLQLQGKYALATRDHETAIRHYKEALTEIPPNWLIRQVFVLIPLMVAYACMRERDTSMEMADKAVTAIRTLNAPVVNKQFVDAVNLGLLGAFPGDKQVQELAASLQ